MVSVSVTAAADLGDELRVLVNDWPCAVHVELFVLNVLFVIVRLVILWRAPDDSSQQLW